MLLKSKGKVKKMEKMYLKDFGFDRIRDVPYAQECFTEVQDCSEQELKDFFAEIPEYVSIQNLDTVINFVKANPNMAFPYYCVDTSIKVTRKPVLMFLLSMNKEVLVEYNAFVRKTSEDWVDASIQANARFYAEHIKK